MILTIMQFIVLVFICIPHCIKKSKSQRWQSIEICKSYFYYDIYFYFSKYQSETYEGNF